MASNVPVCGVCDYRHETKPAIIWCNECDEGLCGECQDHHSSSKASRGHDIVSIEDYTNLPSEIRKIASSCTKHGDKYTTYCRKHDSPCCKKCVIETHNKCVALADINDVIGNVKSSSLVQEIEQNLSEVLDKLREIIRNRTDNMKDIRSQKSEIEKEILQTRNLINVHLDRMQADLLNELTVIEEFELKNIKDGIALLEENEKQVAASNAILIKTKAHASDLQAYIAIKILEKSSAEKINRVRSLASEANLRLITLSWKIDNGMDEIQRNHQPFGKILVERRSMDLNILLTKDKQAQIYRQPRTGTINDIRLGLKKTIPTDGRDIRGCTLLPRGKMIFVDAMFWGKKLLIFREDGSQESEFETVSYDVAYNKDDNTILVTSGAAGNGTINVVDVNQRTIRRTIPCGGYIGGVTLHNGAVIYCTGNGIKIIRLNDRSKSTVTVVDKMMPWRSYVTTFNDNIYHTDSVTNTVTCYDLKGKQQWVFKNERVLMSPGGISVDKDGNIFVTGVDSLNVVVISNDGQHYRELLTRNDGLICPFALHFDSGTKKLLVANKYDKAFLFSVN